jgi:hypothetical protein
MSDPTIETPGEPDIFQKYSDEFTKDTQLDELNLKERAMTTIAIKHKWVGRLMRHKRDFKKLEVAKRTAISKMSDKLSDGVVGLTAVAARKAAASSDLASRITAELEQQELIIEYLEKVERILNSMSYDIKNVIDIQKLETQ